MYSMIATRERERDRERDRDKPALKTNQHRINSGRNCMTSGQLEGMHRQLRQ
jgi:hypothetical protein